MPLRQTDKGWYWGGQGPFPTKAKALQVARAAYASGYREQERDDMNHDGIRAFLGMLMCGQICLRLLHWNTTNQAQHEALGGLYDELADLTDRVAEVYMGIYERFGNVPCQHEELPDPVEYVADMAMMIQAMRADLPNDTQLQNIVDEVAAAVDKTNYLLTLK